MTGSRPVALSSAVSEQMSRMPREGSGPELALRSALHARGLRFRVSGRGLPGSPDIVLSRAKIAVFVDGCFWHACPRHGTLPKNNREWWKAKLDANQLRDRRKDAELVSLGWLPIHVWEHDEVQPAAEVIERLWRERTGRSTIRAGEGGILEVP